MKKTTSYRLDPEIARLVKREGGASFVEGCVLLVKALDYTRLAKQCALRYDQLETKDPAKFRVETSDDRIDLLQRVQVLSAAVNALEDSVISKTADIPKGLDDDTTRLLTQALLVFGDEENPL